MSKIEEEQDKLKKLFESLNFTTIHVCENKQELSDLPDLPDDSNDFEAFREDPQERELIEALEAWNSKGQHPYTLAKEGRRLRQALEIWDQVGENPYEVLQEEDEYDFFMNILDAQKLILTYPIYRGTIRHSDLKVGDTIDYVYPKSWTTNLEMASEFIKVGTKEFSGTVILCFTSKKPVKGIPNPYNTNNEDEVILAPMTLIITRKYKKRGFPIFDVTSV